MASTKFKPYAVNFFDELGIEVPKSARREALEEVATFLHQELLTYYSAGHSPVSGGEWRRKLTEKYREKKKRDGGSDFADLDLTDEMLESLTVEAKGNRIVVDVAKDQYGKAEGHITGQYGKGQMKKNYKREFLPQGDGVFKRGILSGVRKILKEFEDGES